MEKQITVYGIVDRKSGEVRDSRFSELDADTIKDRYNSMGNDYLVIPLHSTYTLPKKLVTKTATRFVDSHGIEYLLKGGNPCYAVNKNEHYKHEVTITYQVKE